MAQKRRVLYVDLTSGAWRVDQVAIEELYGLSGKAFAIRLMEKYLDAKVAALSPENVIVLTPSPLAGLGFSGSDRFGAFTKGPLTGAWLECYSGGNVARTSRETGWDAVVITGAASSPVRLHITAAGATIVPARDLWGKDTFVVNDILLSLLEKRSSVLCIGVAGENQVRQASVMHDHAHALGRGGLGAVFGSKKLKAVTFSSFGTVRVDAADAFVEIRRKVSKLATDSPAADAYRTYGTPVMVAILDEAGSFPTHYWSKGRSPHRSSLEAENWPTWAKVDTGTCPPCPIRCRKILTMIGGDDAGRKMHAPEYETLYTFGGGCMVNHAKDVGIINELCNRLGVDTISAGNVIGMTMKGRDLGLVDDAPVWGDVNSICAALEELATVSTDRARILAQGIRSAADTLHMNDIAIHVKGMEPAGYDPRALHGMAMAYALSPRGACHMRATMYKLDLSGEIKGKDADSLAELYIDWEDRALLNDSLIMCRFYRDFMLWDNLVIAATQLNGCAVDETQLRVLCDDTLTRIRRFNLACGLSPADDTLPSRFFNEATDTAPAVDRGLLENEIQLYWQKRGWGVNGIPPMP